jgi:hypothetical protein
MWTFLIGVGVGVLLSVALIYASVWFVDRAMTRMDEEIAMDL